MHYRFSEEAIERYIGWIGLFASLVLGASAVAAIVLQMRSLMPSWWIYLERDWRRRGVGGSADCDVHGGDGIVGERDHGTISPQSVPRSQLSAHF
ncbi:MULTISPECIES: hypothetical protein [Microvirga]|uniref:hypothetical protein n=1 Tax=Microvirga TaxID=186650 RepID=UPI00058AEEDE|nr:MULTISPECIES: hypothetical protein [Microvirga]WQO30310.1 hypothetical protein U0023_28950 [Microvirga lotononidis]